MIDEPDQDEPSDNSAPEKMTEAIAEEIRTAIDALQEVTSKMAPPMDPRAFGLVEMAADLLLEQIETGRLYYADNTEQSNDIQNKLNQVQNDLTILQNAPNKPSFPTRSLGEQMADDIQKYFEHNDMLPDEEK